MRVPTILLSILLTLGLGGLVRVRVRAEGRATQPAARVGDADRGPVGFESELAIPVEGVAAVRGTLTLSVAAAGEAVAWRDVVLPSPRAGRVERLAVLEGDTVEAGQDVAVLDASDARLDLREAEAERARATVEYRDLTLFNERVTDAVARQERERVARARSGLDAAEIRVERSHLDLWRSVVRAPFRGRVASIEAQPGAWVDAGAPLMRVIDADPIRVEVQMLDGEVGWLERGGAAEVEFSALRGETFAGRVATVNPLVDPHLRTTRVTVLVPNPDGRVLPGMYARVRLAVRHLEDRLLVPRAAILERERRTMLFVFEGEEHGRAKWRYVTLGLGNEQVVEILDSDETDRVEPGDVVLTDGHFSLIHDARVRIVTP